MVRILDGCVSAMTRLFGDCPRARICMVPRRPPPCRRLLVGESPEDLGLQEPDEPRATRRPLREIDECRPALLERKLLAFRSAEETREERAEHRLVTDDGDRRLSRRSEARRVGSECGSR